MSINSTGHSDNWARIATTRDNMTYRIRPICAADAARERAFIMGLSPETRYSRMMYSLCEPSSDLVDRFVRVDHHYNMAFVAVAGRPTKSASLVFRAMPSMERDMSSLSWSRMNGRPKAWADPLAIVA